MFAHVNGVKLYFDVEGASLIADGPEMRERPTVILVHGGPGGDHSVYKPDFSVLSEVAQVVYYDHRGNGRSDMSRSEHWTLDQWADDLKGLCDYLGISNPIVVGASFGGFVAQAYATRHPGHPGKVALISTSAKVDFEEIYKAFGMRAGPEIEAVARRYWENPTDESRAEYRDRCVPLYSTKGQQNTDWLSRMIIKNETALWFNGPKNEQGRMDFRKGLERVDCPVLVMCGEDDPIMPMAFSEVIASCVPQHHLTMHRIKDCAHAIPADQPAQFFGLLKAFIAK